VAFVGAGLAISITDLVNDSVLTFLRRAERHHLGRVPRDDVERGFRVPIEAAGRALDPQARGVMIDATDGYPYLLQLIGSCTWRVHAAHPIITVDDARAGVAVARERLSAMIHEPALAATSKTDRLFLAAMAARNGPVRVAEMAEELGVSIGYAGQYRRRLIAAELIEPAGLGMIDFALPYLREYLRADLAQAGRPG